MNFLNSILNAAAAVGLGHPVSRAIAFASVGFGLQYLIKPGISYGTIKNKNGAGNTTYSKEFILTSSAKSPQAKTWFPWYLWPVLFAIIGGLFL